LENAIRHPRSEDIPVLKSIWKSVFEEDDYEVFFQHYFDPEFCFVADGDGDRPAASGYLFPAGRLISDNTSVPCAMIYAVATLPEYRSRGFATAVVTALITTGRAAGFHAIALCPAEDSLFEYYSARTKLQDTFFNMEYKLTAQPASGNLPDLIQTDPEEYGRLRSRLLAGIPHLEPDIRALFYQEELCSRRGGGLFRADTPQGTSCAIVESYPDDSVLIKELLSPSGDISNIFPAIAAAFPAAEYIVRIPAQSAGMQNSGPEEHGAVIIKDVPGSTEPVLRHGIISRFGMLTAPEGIFDALGSQKTAPWLCPAFD